MITKYYYICIYIIEEMYNLQGRQISGAIENTSFVLSVTTEIIVEISCDN